MADLSKATPKTAPLPEPPDEKSGEFQAAMTEKEGKKDPTESPDVPNVLDMMKLMQEKLQTLEDSNKKLQDDNTMLKDLAGKNTILSWENSKKDHENRIAHMKTLHGKIVVSWGDLDYSAFNPNAKTARLENILTEVTYADGTKEKVNYVEMKDSAKTFDVKLVDYSPTVCKIEFSPETVQQFNLTDSQLYIDAKFLNA